MASSKRPAAKAALPLAFASSDMKAGGAKRESFSDVRIGSLGLPEGRNVYSPWKSDLHASGMFQSRRP